MNPEEIYNILSNKFGESVIGYDSELAGDPTIQIAPTAIAEVCQYLAETDTLKFDSLMCLSGVDMGVKEENLSIVYHLYGMQHRHSVVLKTSVPKTDAHLPTVSHIWKTADWHEREAYDLYGILFEEHTDLRRILMPDDWEGYPLRKDYQEPDFYRGMRVPY